MSELYGLWIISYSICYLQKIKLGKYTQQS